MDQRLTDEELAPVLEPVATARGLPNRHYVDQTWFETERDRLFFDGWAGIGFAKDVPANGDAMPITFLGQPLVAIRGRDAKLRVFLNICRHRGMILIRERGPIRGAIRCPYHSWCYDLDGALKATPHVGGPGHNSHDAIHREDLGLVEVPSHVWRDVIFVNISGDAPPFETAHRAAIERWREFDKPLLHSGADSGFSLDVATNWKLAVENYCESYHLPWVHPGLNSYSRLEDHYNIEEPDAFPVRARWFTASSRTNEDGFSRTRPVSATAGKPRPNISRSIRTCCSAFTATTPSRFCWSRWPSTERSSMSKSTITPKRR
jgi:choline monooxygenase